MTREECDLAIKEWLREIKDEISFLSQKRREAERDLRELLVRTQEKPKQPVGRS